MPSSASSEIGSPEWAKARCLEGECPLHSGMDDGAKKRVLKTCIKTKSYDDEEITHILVALRCPENKHDPL